MHKLINDWHSWFMRWSCAFGKVLFKQQGGDGWGEQGKGTKWEWKNIIKMKTII